MSVELPELDDHSFDDLVAEARALIPALAPDWTNHNPADPGITVLELFAWITETLVYQIGRLAPERRARFLALLDSSPDPHESLDQRRRRVLTALRTPDRAVTAADYEHLVAHVWPGAPAPHRVLAVEGRDLERPRADGPGVVSVVVLPAGTGHPPPDATAADSIRAFLHERRHPTLDSTAHGSIRAFLHERRMLATRTAVVGPDYVPVPVRVWLALRDDAVPEATLERAELLVRRHLDPFSGGPDGTGWPFGRAVRAVEIADAVARDPGVDYVERVWLSEQGDAEPDTVTLPRLPKATSVDLSGWDDSGRRYSRAGEATVTTTEPDPQVARIPPVAEALPAPPVAPVTRVRRPAHSYAEHLPAALRTDPSLMRLVSGLGDVLYGLETAVGALGDCADPQAARAEFLPWLAGWVGMSLRADWDGTTQRTFVAEAVSLHRKRGTTAGLRRILQIHLGLMPGDTSIEIHDQFVDAPHFFEVSIDLSGYGRTRYSRAVEIARQIIDREKPAHTYYALKARNTTPLKLGGNFVLGDGDRTPPLRGGT